MKKATRVIIHEPEELKENTQLISHFRGRPYFEEGDEWPLSDSGSSMDFIFQIFNTGDINLPNNVKLLQFFYDWEISPWSSDEDGWVVFMWEELDSEKVIELDNPGGQDFTKCCKVSFEQFMDDGTSDFQTQIGGIPKWLQYDDTPIGNDGRPMRLLMQIDSDDNARIMWGDMGVVYLFYDRNEDAIEFSLQCC